MTFLEIYARCMREAEEAAAEPFSLWPLTDAAYRMWKANAGNAKARRRWRRRNLPNAQREAALAHEGAEFQRWCAGVYGWEEGKP